jgi:hypothetical protein
LLYDGTTLSIDGTVTIGGAAASTVVSNAATGASDPATRINNGTTTISGGKITANSISATEIRTDYVYTGTINADNITSGTITGRTIQNAASSPTFKVDTSGNVFANNIYATGTVSDLGLQIRADGTGGSTSGAIWVLSAKGKETKIGNTDGSLNIRWRDAVGTVPAAVALEPAWLDGTTWKQNRHFEINMSTGFNFYVNTDVILRGSALDGTGNDYFTDDASVIAGGEDARYVQGTYKGRLMWIISRSGSSIRYK